MKNVSSASLIFFCLTASASALDLTADPAPASPLTRTM
ncbi:Capsular polysaccharide export system periplasmic protein KpsD [Cronobacter dublinensis 582]|nr:Capsular polysaccharide export system periplasmic protein KpsD [Cronobacter dublinensis 582]